MRVIYKKFLSKRIPCIATIGVFDGIHLGHRFILKKVRERARINKLASLVITFDIHPRKLISENNAIGNSNFLGHIISHRQKKELIEKIGIDYLWFLKTGHSFLKLSAKEFLEYILRHFAIKEFVVGEDFRFGYKGRADVSYLKRVSKIYNFNLLVLKKIKKDITTISSSVIRKLIRNGEFARVKSFLGRNYCLEGKVIKGGGLGKLIGFPTANVYAIDYVLPQRGVYAACADIDKKIYLGAVNIGTRPTVSKSDREVVETHILGFNRNILGKTLKLYFLQRIRDEKKFHSSEKLSKAIRKDIDYILRKYKPILPHFNI
jgi:riboflavin kinase/FMN adenylyltransferase